MRLLPLLVACLLSVVACGTDPPVETIGAGGAMPCGLVSTVLAGGPASSGAETSSASASSAGATGGGDSSASTSSAGGGGSVAETCCGAAALLEASAPVLAGEESAVVVVCPAGTVTVTGGCRWGDVSGGVFPTESRPTAGGWRCGGASNGDDDETITAFALCAGAP